MGPGAVEEANDTIMGGNGRCVVLKRPFVSTRVRLRRNKSERKKGENMKKLEKYIYIFQNKRAKNIYIFFKIDDTYFFFKLKV